MDPLDYNYEDTTNDSTGLFNSIAERFFGQATPTDTREVSTTAQVTFEQLPPISEVGEHLVDIPEDSTVDNFFQSDEPETDTFGTPFDPDHELPADDDTAEPSSIIQDLGDLFDEAKEEEEKKTDAADPDDLLQLIMSSSTSTSRPTQVLPHMTLTKIVGKPTPVSLQVMRQELYANAVAVKLQGSPNPFGHLGMLMDDAEFQRLEYGTAGAHPSAWVAPTHPGAYPSITAAMSTSEATNALKQHEDQLRTFETYDTLQSTLKAQILAAVEPTYLEAKKSATLGFAQQSAKQLFDHLYDTYGTITPTSLEKNRALLTAKWDPATPIELLFKRIKHVQEYATLGAEAIPIAVIIRLTLKVFRDTGVFDNAIDKWEDKSETDRTGTDALNNFIAHFTKEDKRRRERLDEQSDTKNAYAANTYHEGYTAGLNAREILANAAAPAPSTTGTPTNSKAKTLREFMSTADGSQCHAVTDTGVQMFYCWSHGLGRNPQHTSKSCNNPSDGHKKEATLANMMGGSTTIVTRRRKQGS